MFKSAYHICVFTLAIAGSCGLDLHAQPNMPVEITRTTGLVGIAEGQSAQLNALNPQPAASPVATASCTGVLTILGDDGSVLKTATLTIAPGTGQHIMVDSVSDLALAVGARRDIRATISVPAAPSTGSSMTVTPACQLIGTLEIFNTVDGHTLVTLGTTHDIAAPVVTPAN